MYIYIHVSIYTCICIYVYTCTYQTIHIDPKFMLHPCKSKHLSSETFLQSNPRNSPSFSIRNSWHIGSRCHGLHWVPDQRYHPAPWPGRGHRSCWSPAVGLSAFCHMALWGERSISNYGIWSIYGHVMILQLFWFVKCCGPQVDMERHISGIYNSWFVSSKLGRSAWDPSLSSRSHHHSNQNKRPRPGLFPLKLAKWLWRHFNKMILFFPRI